MNIAFSLVAFAIFLVYCWRSRVQPSDFDPTRMTESWRDDRRKADNLLPFRKPVADLGRRRAGR